MKETSYTDVEGRRWRVLLFEGMAQSEASLGIPVGPVPLDSLGLPKDIEIGLHNQLHDRRINTAADAKNRRQDIFGAWQAALKVHTSKIVDLYVAQERSIPEPEEIVAKSKPTTQKSRGRK